MNMADTAEKATTAAPNSTTGPAEQVVVPDTATKEPSGDVAQVSDPSQSRLVLTASTGTNGGFSSQC